MTVCGQAGGWRGYSCPAADRDIRECCPADWHRTPYGCYTIVREAPVDWAGASRACNRVGGYLAELTTTR